MAEALHHIALSLLDFKHRPDGSAALGHHGIDAPGAAEQAAHGPVEHAVVEEQRAVAGAVLAGDAAHLHGRGIGVVESADQIVDPRAAGIHEQQHRVAAAWLGPHPLLPLVAGAVEVR